MQGSQSDCTIYEWVAAQPKSMVPTCISVFGCIVTLFLQGNELVLESGLLGNLFEPQFISVCSLGTRKQAYTCSVRAHLMGKDTLKVFDFVCVGFA